MCLFILSNLTFAHFSHYLTLRKAAKGKGRGTAMSLGNATYEQTQSALKHLFRMSKYKMEMSFLEELKQFLLGMKLGWKCWRHVGDMPTWRQISSRVVKFGDMIFSVSADFCVTLSRH